MGLIDYFQDDIMSDVRSQLPQDKTITSKP